MDKIALVTGTNRGIGLEISKQLAASGITVIMTARNMLAGRPVVNELRKQWKHVWFHQLNVDDDNSIHDVYNYIENSYGKLDILINNAGVYFDEGKSALELDIDTLRLTMETNLYGPIRLIQIMMPLLKMSNDARIINLSSTMGQFASLGPHGMAYRISKAALNAMTAIFAAELKQFGIRVNAVHPGWVKTSMGGPDAPLPVEKGADSAVWLATAENIPDGKFIQDRTVIEW